MNARRWLLRASLALGLVLIPSIFADFTAFGVQNDPCG